MTSLTASPSVTPIREIELVGERFVRLAEDSLLVASKSEPGVWHHIADAHCDCKGFQYRGHCRHIAAALELEAETTTDNVTVELTTECGGGWIVKWAGHIHGGIHSNRADAEGHADELRHSPAWDRQQWVERWAYEAPTPTGRPHLYIVGKEQAL